MNAEFSEFSFGFAFIHEYVNHNPGFTAAPELPSLRKEVTVGWDAKLTVKGHPKFFQFKLSEYLCRSRASQWNHHNRPYFRFRITPQDKSDQHNRLMRLANLGNDVLYTAPMFHEASEFNHNFQTSQVTSSSIWVPVQRLPPINGDDAHCITFSSNQILWWHSEPERIEGKLSAEEHYDTINEMITIDEDYFRGLRSKLLAALSESGTIPQNQGANDDMASVLEDVHRLLTTQFGLNMVTLTRQNGDTTTGADDAPDRPELAPGLQS